MLTSLSDLIREQCRASDVAFRYGGDELCILLPDTSQEEAKIAADRLRKAARQIKLMSEAVEPVNLEVVVTMSVGIACYPNASLRPDQLFECADAAMYRAKENGKNRSVIFDPELDSNRLNYRRRAKPDEKDERLTPPRSNGTNSLPPIL